MLEYSPFIFTLGNFLTKAQHFPIDVTDCIGPVVAVLFFITPADLLNKWWKPPAAKEIETKGNWEQKSGKFPDNYDLLNPVTRRKARSGSQGKETQQ